MVLNKFYSIAIVLLLFFYEGVQAQSAVTLDECLENARLNYPLQGNFEYIEDQLDLRLKNLNANYYPKLDLNAQATYQNDVPHIESSNLPFEVPMGPKDQYKASVDFQQVIFDAGRTKMAKEAEQISSETQKSNIEVELYKIRSKVIDSYFLILSINEQIDLLNYRVDIINKRLEELNSAIENGMVLSTQADHLQVEALSIEQDKIKMEEGKKAAVRILETLTNKSYSADDKFVMPVSLNSNQIFIRPEYKYFEDQRQQLSVSQKLSAKDRLPYVAGFGQLGYGNPGFNMLKDEFAPFYMVGIKLKWNIWDWKQSSNTKQYLQIQSNRIDIQQNVFDLNIKMAAENVNSSIAQMQKVMEKDEEIIKLRKKITYTSTSQLKNGTITASDYLNDLNLESVAVLSKQIHQLELIKSQIQLTDLKGAASK